MLSGPTLYHELGSQKTANKCITRQGVSLIQLFESTVRKLIATSIAVLCAGCAPWPTTDRPNIAFQVNDQDGGPIQGALVQFATYSRGMSPRGELHEFHTNEEGRVSVSGEWHWQLVILAADGRIIHLNPLWRPCFHYARASI